MELKETFPEKGRVRRNKDFFQAVYFTAAGSVILIDHNI